jgi:flagellar biosynthesis/type III secretory pathway protein FliH
MAGAWYSMTKRMIGANPEHFTKWLASDATFVAVLDLELKSKHIYADALLEITQEEKPGLLHRKRFNMFQDILKESWVYQEIGQEFLEQGFEKGLEQGLEKGLKKGLEKGLEQGMELGLEKGLEKGREEERQKRVELLHLMLMSIVETQFPEITKLAKQHIDTIDDPDALQTAFIKLLAARNLEQAKGIFSD